MLLRRDLYAGLRDKLLYPHNVIEMGVSYKHVALFAGVSFDEIAYFIGELAGVYQHGAGFARNAEAVGVAYFICF